MKEMNIFERVVGGKRYRIASQSVWDPGRQRPFARQAVLGPADPPPHADLAGVYRGEKDNAGIGCRMNGIALVFRIYHAFGQSMAGSA